MKCDVYSRVVGYYRPVQSWNKGKKEEFADRITYCVEHETQSTMQSFERPVKTVLITSKMCPNCPRAKLFIQNQQKIPYVVVDASEKEGLKLAKELDVMSVPTLVVFDENKQVISKVSGTQNIVQYVDGI